MVPYRKSPQKHSNPKLFHSFAKTIKHKGYEDKRITENYVHSRADDRCMDK
jgi:hypothetical protein